MVRVHFDAIPWLGIHGFGMEPWLGIQSTAAGVWGVAAGFLTIIVVSLFDRPPSQETQNFVESVRYPEFDHW
ncbi:MAG: putative sodium:solute symporter, subfamily [Candidatus Accumulibacter phosphatis]|nr:MAG: putative sodium:solute symporter, subfamily [Candidatus Accumulibacter phosphatis]